MRPSARLDNWINGPVYEWIGKKGDQETLRLVEYLGCLLLFPIYIALMLIEAAFIAAAK